MSTQQVKLTKDLPYIRDEAGTMHAPYVGMRVWHGARKATIVGRVDDVWFAPVRWDSMPEGGALSVFVFDLKAA